MDNFVLLNCIREHGDVYGMIINTKRVVTLDYKGKVLDGVDSWWLTYETEGHNTRKCVVMGTTGSILNLLNGVRNVSNTTL